MKTLTDIIGVLGILYWLATLYILIFRPVLRDRCIVNGFAKYVILLVVLTPFAMEFIVSDCCSMVSPRELVYTPDLYKAPGNDLSDTIRSRQEDPSWLWSIYYLMIDPGNQHMTTSKPGRAVGVIMAILGVFLLNGLLVSTLMSWFVRRKGCWLKGEIRYRHIRKHTVIIGGGKIATGITQQIIDRHGYIVIMTERDAETYRRELFSAIPSNRHRNIILYYGDCSSVNDIKSLNINRCTEIFITGDGADAEVAEQDIKSMKCLQIIADTCLPDSCIPCRLMFRQHGTHSAFQLSDISDRIASRISFKPFSFYEQWARNIFVQWPGKRQHHHYLPLEGEKGITAGDMSKVHFIIIGISDMGMALAAEAAHLAHYPNFVTCGIKSRITFIDSEAENKYRRFMSRYRELFSLSSWRYADTDGYTDAEWHCPENYGYLGNETTDIEWEFIKGDMECRNTYLLLKELASVPDTRLTVAICTDSQGSSVSTALNLPEEIYRNSIQILVYQKDGSSVIDSLSINNGSVPYYKKLQPFGMESECFDNMTVRISEAIADKFSEVYNRICSGIGNGGSHCNTQTATTAKNTVQRGKSKAAGWWSNIHNADTVWSKLRSVNYNGEPINDSGHILAKTEHYRWNTEQLLMGFRPLTQKEQQGVLSGCLDKNALKRNEMAHLDICSWDRLLEIDHDVILYDIGLTEILPEIYEYALKINSHAYEKQSIQTLPG